MPGEVLLYGALAAVFLAHLLILFYLYGSENPAAEIAGGAEAAETADGDVVECRECHTANERGYRFCRSCVAELPGGGAGGRSRVAPSGRGTG